MPVNHEGIAHLLSWEGDVGRHYLEKIEDFKEAAKLNAPYRPDSAGPHLKDTIDSVIEESIGDKLSALIGTNPAEHIRGYSEIVQLGSKPHIIRPKGPGYPLRFRVGGHKVIAWQVHHPGTEPDPFLMDLIHLITG